MVFKCQQDSFLSKLETKIKSCRPADLKVDDEIRRCYEVTLEETIIFPEGGGQPSDVGYIDQKKVLRTERRGGDALHFVDSALEEGKTVMTEIDWDVRLDHMQQHSAQHLISAKVQQIHGLATTSWSLNKDDTMVEFAISDLKFDIDVMLALESVLNSEIKKNTPVVVNTYEPGDPALEKAVTRGLPADHTGPIRVISMAGDQNMCCGTHVDCLGRLQMIKLLSVSQVKKKTQLRFVAGDRVLKHVNVMLERERNLSKLLQNGASDHEVVVSNLLKSSKALEKNLKECSLEVAGLMADNVKRQDPAPKFVCVHRKEDAVGFARKYLSETSPGILKLLTWGDEKGAGQMILEGPEALVAELGPTICEMLGGKGAAKGGRFQAKVGALKNRDKVLQLLTSRFQDAQK